MHNIKKFISTILTIVIILSALPLNALLVSAETTFTEGYYTYTISNEEASIIKCDTTINGDIIIPETLGGFRVISIGSGAFQDCKSITSVKFPHGMKSIGAYAFENCSNIKSVDIPSSVTNIEGYAFSYCHNLTKVILPDSVTSLGSGVFKYCTMLQEVRISNNISYIGEAVFRSCKSLTHITIPEGITSIGSYAFEDCEWLSSISIPNSLTRIGTQAFSNCVNLRSVYITDLYAWCSISFSSNPITYGGANLYLNDNLITNLEIPYGITTINTHTFNNCKSITSVTIPETVSDINGSAFRECTNLINITIPTSVANIYYGAFNLCSSLTDVYYLGTENQWNSISIGESNEPLTSASIHFLYGHEHSFGEWVERKELTCTTNGEDYRICASCGEEETRIVTAEGHIYDSVVTPPTCLNDGYTTHTCQNCDDTYTDLPTLALGHSFVNWIVRTPVTCTENGEEYRICSGCGEEETRTLTALGHDFETDYTIDKYPTENENGSKSKHCKRCDEITDVTVIQGRITEYRYKDKEVTTSEEKLGAPWILYNTSLEQKPTGSLQYKYVKYYDWDDFDYVSFNEKYIVQTYYRACRYVAADGPLTTKYFRQSQYDCATQITINGKTFYHYGNCYNGYDDEYYCIEYYEKSEYTCYSYYKWTDWSEWSTEYISATDKKIVETRIHYTDITLANEEVNSLRLGLLYDTTDESMDCNNDGAVDILDLVLMHNARESVKMVSSTSNSEPQNEPTEQSMQTTEIAYYDEKIRQII